MIHQRHEWIIEELKELKSKGLVSTPRKRGSKGYANFPINWSIEGYFKDYALKERGVLNRAFASYNAGKDRGGIVFIDMAARNKGAEVELQKTLKNPKYVSYRKKMTDAFAAELLDFSQKELSKGKISKASKQKLHDLYNAFREIYTKYEFYNAVWFTVSDDLTKLVLDRLNKAGCNNADEIQSLLSPDTPSFIHEESVDILRTALELAKDRKKLPDFKTLKKSAHFRHFQYLADEYFWIPFGHVGPDLYDELHYYSEIKKLLESGKDIKKEFNAAKSYYKNIKKKHAMIAEKYSLDEYTTRLLYDIRIMILMQDERKELVARTHINFINNLMQRIGKYFGLIGREAAHIYPEFVRKCLIDGIADLSVYKKEKSTHRRFKIIEPDGYTIYLGEDAEVFLKIIEADSNTELKGFCASNGYAKGIARVLLTSDDIHRVKKGDILVTTMTTPDFVPAMRIAAGIITDEGGITCHAAIVSRELGVPCIIGTKNASEIIKDGDLIEMDATNGTIRKLV